MIRSSSQQESILSSSDPALSKQTWIGVQVYELLQRVYRG